MEAGPTAQAHQRVAIASRATALGSSADDADFAMLVLLALSDMARRSTRGQADLVAALRGAGLAAEPRRVRGALRLLQAQGAIDHLVPLSDGGLLLSVTRVARERFATASQWLPGSDDDGDDTL
jgi:hypothetical protein